MWATSAWLMPLAMKWMLRGQGACRAAVDWWPAPGESGTQQEKCRKAVFAAGIWAGRHVPTGLLLPHLCPKWTKREGQESRREAGSCGAGGAAQARAHTPASKGRRQRQQRRRPKRQLLRTSTGIWQDVWSANTSLTCFGGGGGGGREATG
jgi:hypothetical protein